MPVVFAAGVDGEVRAVAVEELEEVADEVLPAVRITLQVLDSLPCLGPVRDLLHLDTSLLAQPEGHNVEEAGGVGSDDADTLLPVRGAPTLFTLTGQDRSGSVVMLRKGLVPELVTEVPLPGVTGMWALHHRKENQEDGSLSGAAGSSYHAYLLLSKEAGDQISGGSDAFSASAASRTFPSKAASGSTMVLETGQELQEVTEGSPYVSDQPTVCAGNLFNNAGICQVCPYSIGLFDGLDKIQDVLLEDLLMGQPSSGICITFAQISDPYVLLLLSNRLALLLVGDPDSMTLSLSQEAITQLFTVPLEHQASSVAAAAVVDISGPTHVSACCLFRDETGWMAAAGGRALLPSSLEPTEQLLKEEEAPADEVAAAVAAAGEEEGDGIKHVEGTSTLVTTGSAAAAAAAAAALGPRHPPPPLSSSAAMMTESTVIKLEAEPYSTSEVTPQDAAATLAAAHVPGGMQQLIDESEDRCHAAVVYGGKTAVSVQVASLLDAAAVNSNQKVVVEDPASTSSDLSQRDPAVQQASFVGSEDTAGEPHDVAMLLNINNDNGTDLPTTTSATALADSSAPAGMASHTISQAAGRGTSAGNGGMQLALVLPEAAGTSEGTEPEDDAEMYVVVCRNSGLLQVFLLPGMQLVFCCRGLPLAHEVLEGLPRPLWQPIKLDQHQA
ncbi:hypothetical protein CEUSTIGMA_g9289.t1 [Chlamydomonas eustigma]|uniref:RSE1/DDB1/CPSF1 second beta-propeller domain-containing protein n=1 Tax=Chlamydomonas eustigma TaxID=1157962 RepID=A0A250XFK8_9CHLO|nr:hypothetical protein CEUSTIGMA_g9289.t1 [Chlamydomonas eustigma]|eukprot:GAX81861.1 hypothetical protein CEUSTIGMA_g9289.t1 [Chlamydomonas eustigma]